MCNPKVLVQGRRYNVVPPGEREPVKARFVGGGSGRDPHGGNFEFVTEGANGRRLFLAPQQVRGSSVTPLSDEEQTAPDDA